MKVKINISGSRKFKRQITVSSIFIKCMEKIDRHNIFINVKHGSKGYHINITVPESRSFPFLSKGRYTIIALPENNTGYDALLIEKLENGKYRVKLTTLKEILGDPREFWRLHDENASFLWICRFFDDLYWG